MPRISVIVATYNSRGSLALTLQSILNQDFRDFEVWVIGDACTDNSAEVVASLHDPRLNWINLPQNTGSQSEPNNAGLHHASGEYVAFIGHDDLWFPWHLTSLIKHIELTQADLVHSLCALIMPWGVFDVIGPPREGVNYDRHSIAPSSWLHRRALIADVGFWRSPDSISYAIDFDFTRRAYLAQKRIDFAPVLSVLKFPSAWWKSYSSEKTPQAEYLSALIEDPHALRERVLMDLALSYSRYHRQLGKTTVQLNLRQTRQSLGHLLGSIGRAIIDRYGRERWPLAGLLRFLNRRNRLKLRLARGLPPIKK